VEYTRYTRIFHSRLWCNLHISQKRLKIDGYMLRGVWQALNSLSIHVAYTAIVPGAYPGEAKMCKKCAKMANFWTFGLNYLEMVEGRWVHAAMRLTSIEFSFHSRKIIAIVPGVYPGGAKMCFRLSWRSQRQMLAPATTYRRDSLEIAK